MHKKLFGLVASHDPVSLNLYNVGDKAVVAYFYRKLTPQATVVPQSTEYNVTQQYRQSKMEKYRLTVSILVTHLPDHTNKAA